MLTERRQEELKKEARKIFSERLGLARAEVYPDQDSAGEALGLKPRRWGGWERARTEPPLWVLRKLPELFGRPLSWFFGLPDEHELSDAEARIITTLRSIQDPELRAAAEQALLISAQAQLPLDRRLRDQEDL